MFIVKQIKTGYNCFTPREQQRVIFNVEILTL